MLCNKINRPRGDQMHFLRLASVDMIVEREVFRNMH
jgi:hypothetical protein